MLGIVGRLVRRVRVQQCGCRCSLTAQARGVDLMARPAGLPLPLGVLPLAGDQLVIALQQRPLGVQQSIDCLPERPVRQLLAALDLVDRGSVVPGVQAQLRLALPSCLPEGGQRCAELAALRRDGFRFPAHLASLIRSE